jgi:hypothetical protein
MPRNTLKAYGDIVRTLFEIHKEKAFPRSDLMNQFLQEMNIILEETRISHLKTMISLDYILLASPGSAYKQASYVLGMKGMEIAKKLRSESV